MFSRTASQQTTSELTPALLFSLLVIAPSLGWSDDDLSTLTPLALAFAAQEAVEAKPSDYRYAIDYQSLGVNFTGTVDPTAAEGLRLDVLTSSIAEGSEPERLEKVTADLDRAAAEEFWCSRMLDSVPKDAELVEESQKLATYRFKPMPTGLPNDGILKHLIGEIGIDKASGAVLDFRLTAPEPFRQAIIAKIKTFEINTRCKQAPNGRHFAEEFQLNMTGSAAFRSFEDHVVRRVSVLGSAED